MQYFTKADRHQCVLKVNESMSLNSSDSIYYVIWMTQTEYVHQIQSTALPHNTMYLQSHAHAQTAI